MYARITLGGDTPFDYAASSSHPSVTKFLLRHYREMICESAGRRSLLTIVEQGSYSHDYNQVVLKIGRRVGMDHLLSMLRYFVE